MGAIAINHNARQIFFFFKEYEREINTFNHQECIKLIKSDSKELYNVA